MLEALRFVQGAVSKKDYQPALTHFRIANGRVTGYNGTIALSSPIELDLTATPKALPFVKAIERCTNATTVIHLTPAGRLALQSGGFKAFVECSEEGDMLDSIVPMGVDIPMETGFMPAIDKLLPLVGTDASRPWAMGILLRGWSAYATNNIILAEHWIGAQMPDINLPASAVKELSRIGQEPTGVRLDSSSVTFFFAGDRWMRSQLLSTEWPDIGALLDRATGTPIPFPAGLYEAVETVAPFVGDEGRIYFREGCITTSAVGDIGATVEIGGLPAHGAYHHKQLMLLRDCATLIDFSVHPQPCPFLGEKMRGVFLGMVDA